jgi:hypothetical protein
MKKNYILSALLLLFMTAFVCAMDWPSEDGVAVDNFGSNQRGTPLLGMVFTSEGVVRAVEEGDILFTHIPGNSASRLPSPLGAWVALDHGDGLISIYSRLTDPGDTQVLENVSQGRVIAMAGKSGWSNRNGFFFSFFDRKERRWINPSMIISPPEDTVPPVINSVELRNADGQSISPAQVRSISQGRYTVVVNAVDAVSPGGPANMAPYRLICSVNGQEIGALNFETFSTRDGVLMAYRNGMVPAKQAYAPYPSYEIGELSLTRGQAAIEIIAQDISGNTRNVVFRLQVE